MIWFLLACAVTPRTGPPQTWTPPTDLSESDPFMVDADFGCFAAHPQVGNSYYSNFLGPNGPSFAAAEAGGPYPVGTVVQMAPIEAMVKRAPGFSPETGDWEFFKLQVVKGETVIVERGTTTIKNPAGTCAGCHAGAAESGDWVCGSAGDGACDPLPGFVVKRAAKAVEKDPRCD